MRFAKPGNCGLSFPNLSPGVVVATFGPEITCGGLCDIGEPRPDHPGHPQPSASAVERPPDRPLESEAKCSYICAPKPDYMHFLV